MNKNKMKNVWSPSPLKKGIIGDLVAFTLIEIMVWILIVSIVMIWWFQALSAVTIWKVRLIQKTDIQKESFYFTQKLFEMIKKWWTIDYEEYFNRKVIWNTIFSSWHFDKLSWFWNYWTWWTILTNTYGWGFYYCTSWNWVQMWTWWCYNNSLNNSLFDFTWHQQRYWQYSLQFVDYNSNFNDDGWDENSDWKIRGDDDDEYIWDWPTTFTGWLDLTELYLLSWDKKIRTIFRWNVEKDSDSPSSVWCSLNNLNEVTWSGCLWTIEYLKLEWKDWWINHNKNGPTAYDWLIDTWIINSEFDWWWDIAWENDINWVPLFPKTINVSEFKVYAYPNKNIWFAWNNNDTSVNISPYIVLKFKLKPSWISRKKIHWAWQELDFSMTINLSDIYSQ